MIYDRRCARHTRLHQHGGDQLHQLGGVGCEEELEDIKLTCAAVGLNANDGQEDNNGN